MMMDVPNAIRRCEEDREFNGGSDRHLEVEIGSGEDKDYFGHDNQRVSGVMRDNLLCSQ